MYDTYPKNETTVLIRWMIRRDFQEVLSIEEKSFEFPWTEDDIVRCLCQRNNIGIIAETKKEEVVGLMIYELYKTKLHLVRIAVHPDWRRQKIGTQMVEKLVSRLSLQKRRRITIEIQEDNLSAQLFFRQCGFKVTHIVHNYHNNTSGDAYLMQYYKNHQEKQNIKKEDLITRIIAGLRNPNNL